MKANADVQWILFNQRGQQEWGTWLAEQETEKLIFVSDEVLNSLSELPTSQGILAIVTLETQQEQSLFKGWLLLDNIQDPGNVGTMIRTADAAGLAGVILGKGTADIYNTKVLRSRRSHYHLPVLQRELTEVVQAFKKQGLPVFGTELNEAAIAYYEQEAVENYALILGNEGSGVSPELLAETTKNLYIPMKGQAESLNVAIAAGVLMFYFENNQ